LAFGAAAAAGCCCTALAVPAAGTLLPVEP
jgi:hypothetical protein